jgi:pimeloyl-ACP methyl ester carboxylesterase
MTIVSIPMPPHLCGKWVKPRLSHLRPALALKESPLDRQALGPLDRTLLPEGVRSRILQGINRLDMHILEAGEPARDRPCLVLLHGFPEIAYSWRKVMPSLAAAGFYVVAPDQRGFGRTTGWDRSYDSDIAPFRSLNLVTDVLALVSALGFRSVAAIVGHDLGAAIAGYAGMIRPDMFHRVVMLSAPFTGAPSLPFAMTETSDTIGASAPAPNLDEQLAMLEPPRKHYQLYYATREAEPNMLHCAEGVHAFLRAYFHVKSGDWHSNAPFELRARTAEEFAKLPTYYVMERSKGMAETVRPAMPTHAQIAACRWLPDNELEVYSSEYARTGFQGGLNWYRCRIGAQHVGELRLFSGRTIDVPSSFIAGERDWGIHQMPGVLQKMQTEICPAMAGCHLVPDAGHWVQQENPQAVTMHVLELLRATG